MRFLAPLISALAFIALLPVGAAGAVTLEQYFYGFNDRDRGVYITGVLDLFTADSSRDPEYRHCVEELGASGMHAAISAIVTEDPRLLSFDAAIWILYEASRRCNRAAGAAPIPDPRAMLAEAEERSGGSEVPDLAGTASKSATAGWAERVDSVFPGLREWRYVVLGLLLLAAVGGLLMLFAGRRREGRAKANKPPARQQVPYSEQG